MKKLSCAARVLSVAALLVFTRCGPPKDIVPRTVACKPVTQTISAVNGTAPNMRIAIEYNAQEKPVRLTFQKGDLVSQYRLFEYDNTGNLTKSTTYQANGQVYYYKAYEYNQAAQLVKATHHHSEDSIYATFTHEYDNDGNRVKTVYQNNERGTPAPPSTITYEYSGGNLVRSIDNGGFGPAVTTEYEYYAERENNLITYDEEERASGGVPNRNLLRKCTRTYPKSAGDFTETLQYTYYTYEYKDGFPTRVISASREGSSSYATTFETFYQYECR